ncbi:dynein regulatory complex subunit 6 [Teleopsis dalmanni]|uniref:dynein regulatory complex subunit 6 n=1 Tax=Teleopsis dalmanni TaxID=139649 RepID=UPI000D32B14C|nr:dynein regulatory complex subunit 6 [Teleopsis dalmanni]
MDYCISLYPDYGDLPMEIILHIFRYLNYTDRQMAGCTCKRWREALFEPEFNKKLLVRFSKLGFSDLHPPAKIFLNCYRPFQNYYFEEVTFEHVQEIMAHIGQTALSLTFDNVDMSDKQFYAIMQNFTKLQELSITSCSHLFMSGSFLERVNDCTRENTTLSSIKHLSLRHNQYLSDAILMRLTSLLKCIESLDISDCHISYHNSIQRRFYPNDSNIAPNESILTFKFVLLVLSLHQAHIHKLNLSHSSVTGQALLALSDLKELQLKHLYLAYCRQLNVQYLTTFMQTQPKLTVLDLSETMCVTSDSIKVIVYSNPMLEKVIFSGCMNLTNDGAVLLVNLKYLQCLDISRCQGITSEGITLGIAQSCNEVLRELRMGYLKVCEECIKCIAQNIPNLTVLILDNCVNGVTDESLQCIIKHLKWLTNLSLEECFRITDTAVTGINISKVELQATNPSMLENFHPPPRTNLVVQDEFLKSNHSIKISLRSKAEEEIILDANRKKAMFAAYELNLIEDLNIEGHSIQNLKGLRSLNLSGCTKITDVSLKYGLKLLELQCLILSNCQQISIVGMEALVLNCPSIQELNLSNCYCINDKSLQVITTKLTRLRSLNISGCSQLTDHSLDAILINCKCLHTLSVHRCRLMYTDIEERLSTLSTLRNLNMDNNNSIDNAEIFRLKKRLDY